MFQFLLTRSTWVCYLKTWWQAFIYLFTYVHTYIFIYIMLIWYFNVLLMPAEKSKNAPIFAIIFQFCLITHIWAYMYVCMYILTHTYTHSALLCGLHYSLMIRLWLLPISNNSWLSPNQATLSPIAIVVVLVVLVVLLLLLCWWLFGATPTISNRLHVACCVVLC